MKLKQSCFSFSSLDIVLFGRLCIISILQKFLNDDHSLTNEYIITLMCLLLGIVPVSTAQCDIVDRTLDILVQISLVSASELFLEEMLLGQRCK